jgi:hypothetical protein
MRRVFLTSWGERGVMGRIALLREQAALLRTVAGSFDIPSIRDQLIALATHCEELAKSLEEVRPRRWE